MVSLLWYQKDLTNTSPILSKKLYRKIWFRNYCNLLIQYFTLLLKNTLKEFVWRGINLFTLHKVLHHGYCKSYCFFKKFTVLTNSISYLFWKWVFTSYLAQLHKVFNSLYEIQLSLIERKLFYMEQHVVASSLSIQFFMNECNKIN